MTSIPFITFNALGRVVVHAERGDVRVNFELSPDVADRLAADIIRNAKLARARVLPEELKITGDDYDGEDMGQQSRGGLQGKEERARRPEDAARH